MIPLQLPGGPELILVGLAIGLNLLVLIGWLGLLSPPDSLGWERKRTTGSNRAKNR